MISSSPAPLEITAAPANAPAPLAEPPDSDDCSDLEPRPGHGPQALELRPGMQTLI